MPGMAVDFKDPISDMFGGSTPIDSTPAPIEVDFKDPISDMFGGSTPIDSTPAQIEVDFKISCTPPELKLIRAAVRKYQSTFEEDDKPSFGTSVAEVCTVYIELIDGDDVD
jgi:coenzyme F420-reducing hydrogenase gamma subunit